VAAAAALAGGCSSASHGTPQGAGTSVPIVEVPGGASAFGTGLSIGVRTPESFGDLMICALEPKAAVKITAISLKDGAQGLRVVDFGTRPNPFLQASGRSFGVRAGTASAHGVTSPLHERHSEWQCDVSVADGVVPEDGGSGKLLRLTGQRVRKPD
jgi:hypothetical protein